MTCRAVVAAMALAAVACGCAHAEIKTETIEYKDGGVVLKGYVAYDDAVKGRRPAVVVFHEWWGLNDYARRRARELAELGYVALAADVYGGGKTAASADEARAATAPFRENRDLMRTRANAALAALTARPEADPARTAAIGYCFGGTVSLELARSGADLKGVVSFHGGLSSPRPADAKNIKAKVLVLTGADDPGIPPDQVLAFWKEMREGGVNWQMNAYGGAVHTFTNPAAGDDPSRGSAYNEQADRRSWQAMKDFFAEIFAPAAR